MIWLLYVVESTCFCFDQEINNPNQIFSWIELFLIWPKVKWLDSMEYIFEYYLEVDYGM